MHVRVPSPIFVGALVQVRSADVLAFGRVRNCIPVGQEFQSGVKGSEALPEKRAARMVQAARNKTRSAVLAVLTLDAAMACRKFFVRAQITSSVRFLTLRLQTWSRQTEECNT